MVAEPRSDPRGPGISPPVNHPTLGITPANSPDEDGEEEEDDFFGAAPIVDVSEPVGRGKEADHEPSVCRNVAVPESVNVGHVAVSEPGGR